MAIRLKDIARDLNVSVITVSKALRGTKDISEATRERVLKRMKEARLSPKHDCAQPGHGPLFHHRTDRSRPPQSIFH